MISKAGMEELREVSKSFDRNIDFKKWISSERRLAPKGTWKKHDLSVALRVAKCSDSVLDTIERLENSTEYHGVDWDMLKFERNVYVEEEKGCIDIRLMQSGDKIYEFCSSERYWRNHAGQSGYCLVRGNKIIQVNTILRN